MTDAKANLKKYLTNAREAVLWKLDGLDEYDLRRPLTPTGTNLLGLVKHLACVDADYLGRVFDRPFPEQHPWFDEDAEDNADMWATPEEGSAFIIDLYRRVWDHGNATIDALDLESTGVVPWWGDATVTLGEILVHLIAETNRHAGHADIVRETIDGAAGLSRKNGNLPGGDAAWWADYRDKVEQAARTAAGK